MKLQIFLVLCLLGLFVVSTNSELRRERRFLGSIKKAVNKVADAAKKTANKAVNAGKNAVDTVKDVGKDVVDTVKDKGKDVVDTVKDKGKDAIDTVKDKGKDIAEDVVDALEDATDVVINAGEDVLDKVVHVVDEVFDSIKFTVKGYKFAKNKLKKTYKNAKKAFEDLGDVVKDYVYEDVVDHLIDVIDSEITKYLCVTACEAGAVTVFTTSTAGTATAVGLVAALACEPACDGLLAVLEDLAEKAED